MLSRVAESIYWMSRYMERAENLARFIDVIHHLVLDLPDDSTNQWESLLAATGDEQTFAVRYEVADANSVTRFLTFDLDNPNSIYSCLCRARENARSVRETISSEMWEQLNRSFLMVRDALASNRLADDPSAFFSHFKKACHLFLGITDTTMTHGEGWHFSRLGRLMERADKTSRILDVKYFMLLPRVDYVGSPYDNLQWGAMLKCLSAFEMYRKQFHHITPTHVVEFLMLDAQFPRSIRYCLIRAEASLHAITGSPANTFANAAEKRLGRLRADLDFVTIDEVFQVGLHEYLDRFQMRLNDVGESVFETFFALEPVSV